jgi:preprotein translocase subunit YajC
MTFSLISNAMAAAPATGAAAGSETFSTVFLLVGFIIIFYFLLWRPQSKRNKEQRNMLSNLQVGDEVVTSGGILGRISRLSNDFVVLMIANNIEVKIQKQSIAATVPKGTVDTI